MAEVSAVNAIANFVFWSIVFGVLALIVNKKLGCLGITLGIGGLMFSAIVSFIGLLPWAEPTPFSFIPFPTIFDVSLLPQPAATCLIAAAGCFVAGYIIERRLHNRTVS